MPSRAALFGAAGAIFAADRASKWWVESRLSPWETIPVLPGLLQIVHSKNTGIAFGLFHSPGDAWKSWLLAALSGVILSALGFYLWKISALGARQPRSLLWGLCLVTGGAAGNLFDRVVFGSVTDFLDLFLGEYHWPAFNLADSAITAGAALILIQLWKSEAQQADGK